MNKEILSRVRESFFSVGPFFLLILLIHFSGFFMLGSTDQGTLFDNGYQSIFTPGFYSGYGARAFNPTVLSVLIAFPLMVLGMSFFGMGADQAMEKMGAAVGSSLTKRRSVVLLALVSLLIGTLVTFAEPDLTLYSEQLMGPSGKYVLIIVISVGVGLLLALAFVRILFQWNYRLIVMFIYAAVFGLGCLVNKDSFFPIVLDGSGVTIGSISVPFVMAMGISVAQVRGSKNAEDDSFGITGLASLGPLVTVMLWAKAMEGVDFGTSFAGLVSDATEETALGVSQYSQLGGFYASVASSSALDILLSLAPLTVIFFIYDFCFLHLDWNHRLKIVVGLVETFCGLFVFMLGVNSGFITAARQMGRAFGTIDYYNNFYAVILICLLIGVLIILAEPAIHVLGKQVEEVSRGSVSVPELYVSLCIGVSMALVISAIRVRYQIPYMYFIVPILLASLLLTFFVPKLFSALAFDSAGVASSTMSSAFLMPMIVSMAYVIYSGDSTAAPTADQVTEMISYGTGVLGLVYVCPLLTIQAVGAYGRVKSLAAMAVNRRRVTEPDDAQIIELPNGEPNSL